jgi:hypothetical protein
MNKSTNITFEALRGIGILLLVGALALFVYAYSFKCRAEMVEGKVVELIKLSYTKDGFPQKSFCPVVSYLPKGKDLAYLDTSATYTNVPEYTVGEKIKIFYDSNHPETSIIGDNNAYLGGGIVAFVGLIFLGIGLVDYLMRRMIKI